MFHSPMPDSSLDPTLLSCCCWCCQEQPWTLLGAGLGLTGICIGDKGRKSRAGRSSQRLLVAGPSDPVSPIDSGVVPLVCLPGPAGGGMSLWPGVRAQDACDVLPGLAGQLGLAPASDDGIDGVKRGRGWTEGGRIGQRAAAAV